MGLERIVIDEPDGVEIPSGVGAHLADDELAERAGAVDEHAATPFAPRRGHEVHRPERGARRHHRRSEEHRVKDEHHAREALEPVQIRSREHRQHGSQSDAAHHGREIAQPERSPRALVQPGHVERGELQPEHDRQGCFEEREKVVETLTFEPQPEREVIAHADQHEIQHHLAGVPAERQVLQKRRERRLLKREEVLRVVGRHPGEVDAEQCDEHREQTRHR